MPQWTATGTESALKKKNKIVRTLLIKNLINRLIIIRKASRITMRIDLKW